MIKFTKMEGLGNDYVYVDCTKKTGTPLKNVTSLAQIVSNRHFGIGSDGLILIEDSETCDFKMRILNADGSEAEMCGNGIRCVGKFVYDKKMTTKKTITVETLGGIKVLELNVEGEKVKTVKVDMGEPILEPEKIPVNSPENRLELKAAGKIFNATCVSMGNPHAVCEVHDVKSFEIEKYGPLLERDKHFPNRANIEFVQIINDEKVKMRVWERGSNETLACGTGACATTVACILNGKTKREIDVELLGGTLHIEWNKEDNHVYMTGPATTVFEGVFDESEVIKDDNN